MFQMNILFFLIIFFAPLLNAMGKNNFKIVCENHDELIINKEKWELLRTKSATIKNMFKDLEHSNCSNQLELPIAKKDMEAIIYCLPYLRTNEELISYLKTLSPQEIVSHFVSPLSEPKTAQHLNWAMRIKFSENPHTLCHDFLKEHLQDLQSTNNLHILQKIDELKTQINLLSVDQIASFLNASDFLEIKKFNTIGTKLYAQKIVALEELKKFTQGNAILPYLNTNIDRLIAKKIVKNHPNLLANLCKHIPVPNKILTGNTSNVIPIAWSPDGTMLAGGCSDGAVYLWDKTTAKVINRIIGHTEHVNSIAWSPDGSMIASGSQDKTIRLWDSKTGNLSRIIEHKEYIHDVEFCPDGTTLVSRSNFSSPCLWDLKTGHFLKELEYHNFGSLIHRQEESLSSDGTMKVHSSNKGLYLSNTKTHKFTKKLPDDHCWSVAMSPDDKSFASSSNDTKVYVWDIRLFNKLQHYLLNELTVQQALGLIHFVQQWAKLDITDNQLLQRITASLDHEVQDILVEHYIHTTPHIKMINTIKSLYKKNLINSLVSGSNASFSYPGYTNGLTEFKKNMQISTVKTEESTID